MSEIKKTAIVPYSNQQMLELVNDVSAYPEFLKWCRRGYVLSSDEQHYTAGMVIKIKGVQIEFQTANTIATDGDNITLTMNLLKGPFRNLTGVWEFSGFSAQGCKVSLHMSYEIRSQLLGRLFAKGFDQIAGQMVTDFVRRAGDVYG